MSSASSPLPSPSFPWHIAQSKPYDFLPAASAAGVAFTGFASFDASGGILYSAAAPAAGAFCSCRAETAQHKETMAATTPTAFRIGPPRSTHMQWVKAHSTPEAGIRGKVSSCGSHRARRQVAPPDRAIRNARSRVRKRFAETRLLILQFASFQYLPAIQALHILRILILGNQLRSLVLAGRLGC